MSAEKRKAGARWIRRVSIGCSNIRWVLGNHKPIIAAILLLLIFANRQIRSSTPVLSELEIQLQSDIADHRLDDFPLIEAAFILSGVDHPDSLAFYCRWYEELLQSLRDYHFDSADRVGSAAKVFSYLHANWLLTYREQATTLIDVVRHRQFNCVAGTLLFNLVCDDLGWSTEAFETPSHTYTLFSNFTEQIAVDNTTPMGFDIMRNLHDYSVYLRRFYPQNEAVQIGFDRLYAYENSKGRIINNTELLGLLAYNRAYLSKENRDYATAYEYVLLAQSFNADSRSNVRFEVSLYQTWGKALFDEQNYSLAFQILADAAYRYWNIEEFAKNCKAAYFLSMNRFWQVKNWPESRRMTEELLALDILDPNDARQITSHLQAWRSYLVQQNRTPEAQENASLLEQLIKGRKSGQFETR